MGSLLSAVLFAQQAGPLRIVSGSPVGELDQPQDANEICIVFSEPMIALGKNPDAAPPWFHVTPAIDGTYRWSGTSILVLTPNPAKPLPLATTYTVSIDRGAAGTSGRALAAGYTFTFTTPTVKLLSLQWVRQTGRFDGPVALALTFNQPVRPADVLAHTTARLAAHDFDIDPMSDEGRARLRATDPAGLARYDAKVAQARAVSASTTAVGLHLATTWDRTRFPEQPEMVVLETATAPSPGAWLSVAIDARMPSPAGSATPGVIQTNVAELEPPLFVAGLFCSENCQPSLFNPIRFTTPVRTQAFIQAVTVRDVTTAAREAAVSPPNRPSAASVNDLDYAVGLETAGFSRPPGMSRWLVRIDPALTAGDGQTLGYPWIGVIATGRDDVFTSFGDGHGVWETSSGPLLPFHARNLRTVQQWLAPVSPSDLMTRLRALTIANFNARPGGTGTRRTLSVTPDAVQSYGFDLSAALSASGTGLVWAAVQPVEAIAGARLTPEPPPGFTANPRETSTIVQVTNIGLTVKDSPSSTLIFATRLDNGQAEADVNVSLVDLDNKTLWKGRTNKDGVAMAPALDLRKTPKGLDDALRYSQFRFVAIGEKNGDVAYVGSDWNEGISPWEFGMNYSPRQIGEVLRGSVFTDRGVYRPGEVVHFKTILRHESATGVALLKPGTVVHVRVDDNRGRTVDTRTVTMSKWSGADWSWTVPADGSVGDYIVSVSTDAPATEVSNDVSDDEEDGGNEWLRRVDTSFLVAAYRRPDFRVDTTLTTSTPVAGETLQASVNARYLFGNPMARRPVRWRVDKEISLAVPDAIRNADGWRDFTFGYYPETRSLPERPASTTAALDPTGTLVVNVPTETKTDLAYTYSFSGEVEDVTRQRIAGSSAVIVYPAPFLVGLRVPDYFAKTSTGTTVDVAAVDLSGRARAGVPVALSLKRVQWNSVRRAEGSGFYEWDTERIEVPSGEWTVTTGAAPVAQAIPLPEGGYYELTAVATDAQGHTTRTDTSFYGTGDGYTAWQRYDHNRIELKPERTAWKPGETAKVMILSPWESATALMTVEREGVRTYRRFALTSTQQTVDIPITEQDIPNLFVSVLLVRGRTSDDPGDGSDPGKPSFRLGYAELKVEDASKQLTVNVKADRDEYRPTTKANVAVTAVDAAGKGARTEVTLWAVDYGVLSLTGYGPPDLRRAVYVDRPLLVSTEDNRERLVSRRVLTPKGGAEGGGGGADGGANELRKDFRPLAFWLGSVETNANGKATATVTLPDSLTTYHIMAVAGDAASRFGSATSEIRVSKPLTLLPALPRFMSVGDRASFGGAVTNTLPTGGTATVTIKSLDPAILDVTGSAQVALGGAATEAVRFSATARAAGTARIQMTATLGANADAFETTIPVTIVAPLETVAASGETHDRAVQPIALPAGIQPTAGGLTVDLASTALVGLGEGARYIDEYPFTGAEQKSSRALVLLLASDVGQAFSMKNIAPKDYRTTAASLLKSLETYQCDNGGFALWPGQCRSTSAYLTAYVLHVMHVANALGVTQDDAVMSRALDYLEMTLKDAPPQQAQFVPVWAASMAFGVKMLAENGRNQDANITRLYTAAGRMPTFALSYLADALAASNDRGPRYQDVVRRLTNGLRVERDLAHIEALDPSLVGWIWDNNANSTAVVLEGFARRGDAAASVAPMARWLLSARQNGRWQNTQDNARALEGLIAYYKAFETAEPNFTAMATLGARTVGTGTFTAHSTTSQTFSLTMRDVIAATTAATPTDLVIAATGTGTAFYTARLQYAPGLTTTADDHGITVERRFETFVENGDGAAATTFSAGDLVRVTLTVSVPSERRFVAVTDPLPAGFEAVDGAFRTTAADLARVASEQTGPSTDGSTWTPWWMRDGFDRIEKRDDRVELFATKLGTGRYEFTYLVRATTSGTFVAAGTRAEQMYAPDVNGRAGAATIIIK
jgi:uncharacterized protein YfaS (alpha-2-macroglobulin family)